MDSTYRSIVFLSLCLCKMRYLHISFTLFFCYTLERCAFLMNLADRTSPNGGIFLPHHFLGGLSLPFYRCYRHPVEIWPRVRQFKTIRCGIRVHTRRCTRASVCNKSISNETNTRKSSKNNRTVFFKSRGFAKKLRIFQENKWTGSRILNLQTEISIQKQVKNVFKFNLSIA